MSIAHLTILLAVSAPRGVAAAAPTRDDDYINTDPTSTKYVYNTYMPETLTGRLNFRLSPEQEQALRHAAALTGQSLSGFVLSAAVDHAHDLLARANRIELSEAAFRRFVAALDEPGEAAPELVRLARRKSRIPAR
ncbi:Protein of unknown function [Mycobacterium canettii CIPT 140070017]|nr:Protein of unknown function [Mycobacterium canettii CIPT 140070017]